MPAIANLSAWIQVECKVLPEYRVQYSPDGQEVTCWIPSEAGKASITTPDSVRESTTGTKVFVDGQPCGSQISYAHDAAESHSDRPSTLILKGAMTSGDIRRPFLFSDCQLVDDDNVLDNAPSIGQIEVRVNEIQVFDYADGRQEFSLHPLVIHERTKKGLVHGIGGGSLGEGVTRIKKVRNAHVRRRLAKFTFNYRPLAYLLAEGIVPSPQPMRAKRRVPKPLPDVIDLTIDESAIKTEGSLEGTDKSPVTPYYTHTLISSRKTLFPPHYEPSTPSAIPLLAVRSSLRCLPANAYILQVTGTHENQGLAYMGMNCNQNAASIGLPGHIAVTYSPPQMKKTSSGAIPELLPQGYPSNSQGCQTSPLAPCSPCHSVTQLSSSWRLFAART
ncbi:hypothetical protein CVT26_015147 [Gymnopilus dilepis]|uniref:DUF7918 domain-containing protein n=1 Tax=Gymnopilus dilepis TaxID=231916 RepID=A0A409WXX9_9AGAR|nr:hypothetical protein CVT26_015147 [Gymnopilus dilepis]